jgi:hypothetical protein
MSEIKISLCEFRERVRSKHRIGKSDVGALQRGLLGDGLATREEVLLLLGLDRAVPSAHPSWTGFLVAAVVDFVVWGSRPTGHVDEDTGAWLVAALSGGGAPTRRGIRIAAEILEEAGHCHPALAAVVVAEAPSANAEAGPFERMAA